MEDHSVSLLDGCISSDITVKIYTIHIRMMRGHFIPLNKLLGWLSRFWIHHLIPMSLKNISYYTSLYVDDHKIVFKYALNLNITNCPFLPFHTITKSLHGLPIYGTFKATSWSTIPYAHMSATIQQVITKFSAVVTYVKWWRSWKFQFICIWVTMLTKYAYYQYGGKSWSKNKN